MEVRRFTVGEVDGMIPTLERIFTRVLHLRVALSQLETKLGPAGASLVRELSGGAPERTEVREPIAVRQAKAVLRGLWEALAEALAEIRALGGEVKDLETGLVDFLGQRGDEEVYLCWKLGERRIEHWHAIDAGFGGRQPLDEQIARTPRGVD